MEGGKKKDREESKEKRMNMTKEGENKKMKEKKD